MTAHQLLNKFKPGTDSGGYDDEIEAALLPHQVCAFTGSP